MQEQRREQPRQNPSQKSQPPCPPPQPTPCDIPHEQPQKPAHDRRPPPPRKDGESITGFLRNLLPRDLDTGDLLIILLLLLMAGDCEKDRNNALLTLALYFFM